MQNFLTKLHPEMLQYAVTGSYENMELYLRIVRLE